MTTATRRPTSSWRSGSRRRSARCSTWRSRPRCSPTSSRAWRRWAWPTKGRVIVEKPFGRDRASARQLNTCLAGAFAQDRHLPDRPLPRQGIRRGSAGLPVRQRDPGTAVEPPVHRQRADHHGRGVRHRRPSRVLRRCRRGPRRAAEPPAAGGRAAGHGTADRRLTPTPTATRNSRSSGRSSRSTRPTPSAASTSATSTRPGVATDSTTETFVSTKLAIQSWRWAGVPFHVRTGKCMPGGATEAVIELHRPPRLLFAGHERGTPGEPT